jgi:hypothetical protein
MQRLLRFWLLFLVVHSKVISGATFLRTATITRGTPSELDWCVNRPCRSFKGNEDGTVVMIS